MKQHKINELLEISAEIVRANAKLQDMVEQIKEPQQTAVKSVISSLSDAAAYVQNVALCR